MCYVDISGRVEGGRLRRAEIDSGGRGERRAPGMRGGRGNWGGRKKEERRSHSPHLASPREPAMSLSINNDKQP